MTIIGLAIVLGFFWIIAIAGLLRGDYGGLIVACLVTVPTIIFNVIHYALSPKKRIEE